MPLMTFTVYACQVGTEEKKVQNNSVHCYL